MPGTKVQKLCGCGRLTQSNGLGPDGLPRYKSSCTPCRTLARKYKKDYCEKCGGRENLQVDHIDGNRSNNKEGNLQTLCNKCHIIKTNENKDNLKRMTKTCGKCNETKQLNDFGTFKRAKDGKQSWCKSCMKQVMRERYERIASQKPLEAPQSKVCLGCKRELPVSQFGARRASLDHLQQYCKPCWREMTYRSIRKAKNGGKA